MEWIRFDKFQKKVSERFRYRLFKEVNCEIKVFKRIKEVFSVRLFNDGVEMQQ